MKLGALIVAGARLSVRFHDDHAVDVEGREYGLEAAEYAIPCSPSKIVCVGRNYQEHAAELGNDMPDEPLLFLKPTSSLIPHLGTILLPEQSQRVEHEGELGVVIGRECSRLANGDDVAGYIRGYTCLNDVTARDVQKHDVQFTRGKSFDTFCPIGPYIETELDPNDLKVEVIVNGETKQSGRTSQMKFGVAEIVRYISRHMTLFPGDVIATGTPAGVAALNDGDVCEVTVDGIGTLRNTVKRRV